MGTIPLDLERRLAQRWAARFAQPARLAQLQEHRADSDSRRMQEETPAKAAAPDMQNPPT